MSELYPDLVSTNFPEIDNWNRYSDPTASDLEYINQYYTYYNQGNLAAATKVLEEHSELMSKMINASSMNQLRDAVIAMERYYTSDVRTYLMQIVKYVGMWTTDKEYKKFNIVGYMATEQLEYFIAIQDVPSDILPTDTTYWLPVTLKGDKGESGTGLTYRGIWNQATYYYAEDLVIHNNSLWACTQPAISNRPSVYSRGWDLVLDLSASVLTYDNTKTGLPAETMQQAIDVLSNELFRIDSFTIRVEDWVNNTYTVYDPRITSTTQFNFYYNNDSIKVGRKAKITYSQTTGSITLTCEKLPLSDITVDSVVLFNIGNYNLVDVVPSYTSEDITDIKEDMEDIKNLLLSDGVSATEFSFQSQNTSDFSNINIKAYCCGTSCQISGELVTAVNISAKSVIIGMVNESYVAKVPAYGIATSNNLTYSVKINEEGLLTLDDADMSEIVANSTIKFSLVYVL